MATLQTIGTTGLVGVAPTPVLQHAINRYLINDDFMNVIEFVNIAVPSNLGNFQCSGVYYSGTTAATFRQLGVDYNPDNEAPQTWTEVLKFLGGAFEADVEIARALGQNPGSVANWEEQQISQKINAIKNGLAKYFIQGDSTSSATQFDGLNKRITEGQVESTPINVYELTPAKAIQVEVQMNKVIGKIKPKRPNVIFTTSDGRAILTALNAYRNRGIEAVEVNSRKYDAYMGIPIVVLDNCFPNTDTADGKIPVIFGLIDEFEGIRFAIPQDGQVLIILPPKFENGKVVERGACEMAVTPIWDNPYAIAKCYLTEAEPETDGGEG